MAGSGHCCLPRYILTQECIPIAINVRENPTSPVVFQIKCRNFSFLLLKSISSASKLRQRQVWRTEICAAKIQKFSRMSEKSAASANDLKNPRYRIVLVNDLLQIGFSSALPSSSISASSFDLNNYSGSISSTL